MEYSVLMSLYFKETPAYLQTAIESMLNQTAPPSQFVVVCDGPLTEQLDETLSRFSDRLDVVRLPENKGLANALNAGLKHCKYELVARMDSDDISLPDRCAKQLTAFEKDSELALLGGIIDEFDEDPAQPYARRVVPRSHADIVQYSKSRSPFNHVTMMYKKSVILSVGGYDVDFKHGQDYELWFRVLQTGVKTANLPETLVKVRAPSAQIKRRGGLKLAKQSVRLSKKMLDAGWINRREYVFTAYPKFIIGIMPNFVRVLAYKMIRKQK